MLNFSLFRDQVYILYFVSYVLVINTIGVLQVKKKFLHNIRFKGIYHVGTCAHVGTTVENKNMDRRRTKQICFIRLIFTFRRLVYEIKESVLRFFYPI